GGLIPDQPKGYIQRVGLGVLGFALFGSALGNLGYMANDWNYRPILLLIIFAVEMNDIFAYICGYLFGHRKFVPNTSPNKTAGGILDRFDSLILVALAVFHYVNYFVGFAAGQPQRIFSGWEI